MSEVTKLTVVAGQTVPDAKARLMERFDEDMVKMRKWLQETGMGGYAVVAYDRDYKDESPRVHSWVNYFCNDPADAFWLPDMAKVRIHERAHNSNDD